MTASSGLDRARLRDEAYKPLEAYGVVGNLETVALIGRDGAVDWCCLPRVDSPSVFARLLDHERGGHLTVAPTRSFEAVQTYVDRTNVLQTRFRTPDGRATVTDFMPVPGRTAPDDRTALYRRVTGERGAVDLVADFEPRFDYARTVPTVERTDHGVRAAGGAAPLFLTSAVPFEVAADAGAASAPFTLQEGETRWFVLGHGTALPDRPADHRAQLDAVVDHWREWAHSCPDATTCPVAGPWHDLALRSELLLRLLIQRETGTICAAPTTSLPEEVGGVRNWDYRFNWIRDAAFTVQALAELGHLAEAEDYFEACLAHCAAGTPAEMQPVYGLHGRTDLDERTLDHLEGYRGSSPVRLGNEAADQRQLDVYGELVVGVHEAVGYGADLLDEHWSFVREIVEHVGDVWNEPDVGIWETRGDPEGFVYSKVMCWAALDRAIDLVETTAVEGPVERWRRTRATIRETVLERGYDESLGSFVRSFEADGALDAAVLRIPAVGFLPGDDPRVASTVDAVLDRLTTPNGLLRRLEGDDGVAGTEGRFVVCSFWLIDALVATGRVDLAATLFERVAAFASPLGLLAEEADATTGRQLGNTPQAFSHIGVLTSALSLADRVESGDADPAAFPPRRPGDCTPTAYPGHEPTTDHQTRDNP